MFGDARFYREETYETVSNMDWRLERIENTASDNAVRLDRINSMLAALIDSEWSDTKAIQERLTVLFNVLDDIRENRPVGVQ